MPWHIIHWQQYWTLAVAETICSVVPVCAGCYVCSVSSSDSSTGLWLIGDKGVERRHRCQSCTLLDCLSPLAISCVADGDQRFFCELVGGLALVGKQQEHRLAPCSLQVVVPTPGKLTLLAPSQTASGISRYIAVPAASCACNVSSLLDARKDVVLPPELAWGAITHCNDHHFITYVALGFNSQKVWWAVTICRGVSWGGRRGNPYDCQCTCLLYHFL